MTLYLLRYNNYYNRIVKRKTTVAEYLDWADDYQGPITGVNFVPGDGVSTTALINHPDNSRWDYLLVVDAANNIEGRWFIIDETRTAGGQWKMTLYRDLIAEWYDDIVEAPVFIEKAMLAATDPAIFNSEEMTFNQIKKSETAIKDNTGIPWIVGYISKKPIPLENRQVNIPTDEVVIAGEYDDMDSFPYKNRIVAYPKEVIFVSNVKVVEDGEGLGQGYYALGWNNNHQLQTPTANSDYADTGITGLRRIIPSGGDPSAITSNIAIDELYMSNIQADLTRNSNFVWSYGSYVDTASEATTNSYINAAGNIYKIGDEYYHYNYDTTAATTVTKVISPGSELGNDIIAVLQAAGMNTSNTYKSEYLMVEYSKVEIVPITNPIYINSINFTLNETFQQCVDAPYNIFAIPFGELDCDLANHKYSNAESGYSIAQALQIALDEHIYDLQLLPYCPIPSSALAPNGSVKRANTETETNGITPQMVQDITDTNGNYLTSIFFIRNSTFSKSINRYNILIGPTALNIKISNECDMYRLCSPNYNGQFEFSAAKNGGVNQWNIDCTYRPFTPYIHVAPDFGGLYGKDFDDARGLICGGDFSLPQITDKWQNYQTQNKNYQNIFDRQIENMEVQNKYAKIADIWNVVSGTLQGGTTGAMTGAMASGGNPYAMAGGAIVGTATSLAGGLADLSINNKLRAEALDYTKDQFGYQLGSIKALPYSLTKVSAYNANNKIFPFVEHYSCTEIEKQALRDKITYNGMSVGRIGTISQFQQINPTYIKGKLIRLEGTGDDYHIINAISAEINKGVFI